MEGTVTPQLCDLTRHTALVWRKLSDPFSRTLADTMKAAERSWQGLNARLLKARRFVLSDDLTELAATLSARSPDFFLNSLPSCRLPFPEVWFEWDEGVRLAVWQQHGLSKGQEDGFSGRRGMLCERLPDSDTAFTVGLVNGYLRNTDGGVAVLPFGFVCDTDRSVDQNRSAADRGVEATVMLQAMEGQFGENFALGAEYERLMREQGSGRAAQRLADHCRYTFFGPHAVVYRRLQQIVLSRDDPMRKMVDQFEVSQMKVAGARSLAGEWPFLLAVLVLLNTYGSEIDDTRVIRPAGQRLFKGKLMPYLEYRRVELRVPKEKIHQRVLKAAHESRPKRRHEVEEAWCYRLNSGDPKCPHTRWEKVEDSRMQQCPDCGRLRWRRKSYLRGDASLGFIRKDYVVTRTGKVRRRSYRVDAPPALTPDPEPT